MSEARQKLIKLCLEKYPGTSKAHAEKIADQILKEEREKSQSDIKTRIKRKAGIK